MLALKSDVKNALYLGIVIGALVLMVTVVVGVGTAARTMVIMPFFLVGMIIFVSLPARKLLWIYLITTIIFAGLVEYYLRIQYAFWLPSMIAMGFVFWSLPRKEPPSSRPGQQPIYITLMMITLIFWLLISLANINSFVGLVVGSVSYFMTFLAIPGLAKILRNAPAKLTLDLEKAICIVPFIQLPFVLHQRFVVAAGTTNWDLISGTFGGAASGIGRSGDLMMFMVTAFAVAIHRFQHDKLKKSRLFLLLGTILLIIALGETKAFFFLLPLVLFIQQLPNIRKRPTQTLFLGLAVFGAIYSLLSIYETNNYVKRYGESIRMSPFERLNASVDSLLDPTYIKYEGGEIGRYASVVFWRERTIDTPVERWFGFGVGASRKSSISTGVVATKYAPLKLGATSLAQLLWDTGILGAALFIITQMAAIWTMLRCASRETDLYYSSRYRTIAAVLIMLLVTMIYNNSLIESPFIKCLFILLLTTGWTTQFFRMRSAKTAIPAKLV